jgi:CDP-glucose 4,6-dehydratase
VGIRQRPLEVLEVTLDFWEGRRVLLTGHTGFKGSWLSLWLARLGADVVGFAEAPRTEPALYELARIGELVDDHRGDVRRQDLVEATFKKARPEVVLHLAAQPLVRASYRDPVLTYATNVMGTVHVLEAARRTDSVRVVVNVTSDKCYAGPSPAEGHHEDDPKGGADPYSSSKGCSELVTEAYRTCFYGDGVALASARAGNVLGGGDWSTDRLIPDVIRAQDEGHPAVIRNPDATRPWQHVLDPLGAYLTLAQLLWDHPDLAGGWNFGPTPEASVAVREVLTRFERKWGRAIRWETTEAENPPEAARLQLNVEKAREKLGWIPRWDLDQTLAATADWYRRVGDGDDARKVSLSQIEAYQQAEAAVQIVHR